MVSSSVSVSVEEIGVLSDSVCQLFVFFTFFRLCTIQTQAWAQRWPHTAVSPCGPPESLSFGFSLSLEGLQNHTRWT